MKRTVRWRSLELEGTGVWRDSVEVIFPERLGVLALPNEMGKSTLVHGLAAILYGFPSEEIPQWRSWGSDGPFRGRLDLVLDGRTIRIRRDFASHKTIVEEIADGRPLAVRFNDTANPRGTTSSKLAYDQLLREILGDLADPELFRATFLVTQPVVPAGELRVALPRLIGGIGRVSGEEARDLLFEDVKRLTRETGGLGISVTGRGPARQKKDGRIEEAEARLEDLERRKEETVGELARIAVHEDALREADDALARAVEEDRHARADAERLASFRKEAAAFEEARKGRDSLADAVHRYDDEIGRASEIEESLARDFPDLAGAPAGIEGAIDEAISLESRLEAARADLQRLDGEMAENTGALEGLRRWEALPGRPDPVAWVARVRATAERWCETVSQWEGIAEEKRAADAERPRFDVVADLPEDVLDSLARLPGALAELGDRERIAARSEEGRRLLEEGIARRREAFERRWAALRGITPERILATLDSRVSRHRKLREIGEEIGELDLGAAGKPLTRPWTRVALIGVAAAAIAAAVLLMMKAPTAAAAAAAAAVIFAVVAFLLSRSSGRSKEARRRRAALEQEAGSIRASLTMEFLPSGPWLPDDVDAAERARAAFREMDEEDAAIRLDEEGLATDGREEEAARFREEARERRERLEAIARDVEAGVGVAAAEAVRVWRAYKDRLRGIEERRRAARREILDAAPAFEEADAGDPLAMPLESLGPKWRPLVEAGAVLVLEAARLGELRAKLAGLAPADWDRLESNARGHADAQTALAAAEAKRRERAARIREMEEALAKPLAMIGQERITASDGNLAALRARLRARAEASPKRDLAMRVAGECLKTARDGPYADREALGAALSALEDRRRDAQHRMDAACEESDVIRSYHASAADPAAQDRIRRDVESRREESALRLEEAKETLARARASLDARRSPTPVNLAAIEIEAARLREMIQVLIRRRNALVLAWKILGEAVDEFRSAHRETLAEKIDARFRTITRREGRRIALDSGLGIQVIEEGSSVSEERLSQGARDQLAFSLRIAVAELIEGEIVLPLVLDDPFVHSDAERLARIRAALESAARDRQVILLTQDERLAQWGEPVSISPRSR